MINKGEAAQPSSITGLAKQMLQLHQYNFEVCRHYKDDITMSTTSQHSRFGVRDDSPQPITQAFNQTRRVQLSLLVLPPSSHASDGSLPKFAIGKHKKSVQERKLSPVQVSSKQAR
jgi:hypothetical protein